MAMCCYSPHGLRTSVSLTPTLRFKFQVATNDSLSLPVSCSAHYPNNAIHLPQVPYTLCTKERSIVWGWVPIEPPNGSVTFYSLTITDAEMGLKSAKLWDASDFPMVPARTGSTEYQNFTGAANFDI